MDEDSKTGFIRGRGFAKFDEKENVSNCIQLKTSVIKGIKNQLIEQFPGIEPWLNQIMPKKDPVKIVRCHEHIEILTVNGELLFFRQREGPFYPTLRLLHKYPFILPHQQVDKGAIKFVLSGANIMCPGLTSPGAKLYPAAADTIVAIMAEGKQHALCVGVMKMSAEDMKPLKPSLPSGLHSFLRTLKRTHCQDSCFVLRKSTKELALKISII
ncbi:malignant T-cell-amplified sequence 1 isoform X3 [Cavia porcellus]|uniref:malignant T-cell-amplified sequence 1 isoform X3 n=1 Tax=Cavia porcellus TaxID=10141 RepID=UPI002FE11E0C